MKQTLFEKVGGFGSVSKIIMDFYDRILDSEKAGDFFDNIDMAALVDHQTKFVSSLMGGPASYTDEQLRKIHTNLGIDNESFDEMIDVLRKTLTDHGLDSGDIGDICRQMEVRRHLVVTS